MNPFSFFLNKILLNFNYNFNKVNFLAALIISKFLLNYNFFKLNKTIIYF